MRAKYLIGKNVIDKAGDDLGKVSDIELDWNEKSIKSIVIKGDPKIKQKIMKSKYASQLFDKIGAKADPDIVVQVSEIESVGDVITLLIDIQ